MTRGAARARWPDRPSKPRSRGSPAVGRFDSFASPSRSPAARHAVTGAAGYCDVELNLDSGERGSLHDPTLQLHRDPELARRELPVLAMLDVEEAVLMAGDPQALAAALRAQDPPLVGRVHRDTLLLDPRTLTDAEVDLAVAAVRAARS